MIERPRDQAALGVRRRCRARIAAAAAATAGLQLHPVSACTVLSLGTSGIALHKGQGQPQSQGLRADKGLTP